MDSVILETKELNAWFGVHHALKDISMQIPLKQITAVIGPSGCGKSTFIRCLNRMHEVVPGSRVAGRVLVKNQDIYESDVSPVIIRRQIGMVFQRPNPFPTMSVYDNVASGLRLNGVKDKSLLDHEVEHALQQAALWAEVKNQLKKPATHLSGGQQQRLCIARALAVEPEIILFDEPCSALDPISTAKIEELMLELKKYFTIIIVTHNMQQAARVSDMTGFFLLGELIEFGITQGIFTTPKNRKTEDYITGRFG